MSGGRLRRCRVCNTPTLDRDERCQSCRAGDPDPQWEALKDLSADGEELMLRAWGKPLDLAVRTAEAGLDVEQSDAVALHGIASDDGIEAVGQGHEPSWVKAWEDR